MRILFLFAALLLALPVSAQLRPADGTAGSSAAGGGGSGTATNLTSSTNASAVVAFTNTVVGRTVHVMTNGNDATALADDFTKPALTFNKAIDLASAGYTIVGWPGTFLQSSNLWRKSGVNYHFMSGCVLVLTNISTDRGWGIFDDRFSNMAVTSNVSGSGRFRWCGGLPTIDDSVWTYVNSAVLGLHVQTNPLTRTVISGVRFEYAGFGPSPGGNSGSHCKAGTNFIEMSEGGFDLYFRSNHIDFDETLTSDEQHISTVNGNFWGVGEQHLTAPVWQGKGYAFYGQDAIGGTAPSDWFVTVNKIEGKYYMDGNTNLAWRTWFTFKELNNTNGASSGGAAGEILDGGRHYLIGCGKMNSGSSYGFSMDGGEVWLGLQKMGAQTGWIKTASTGKLWLTEATHFEDNGGIANGFEFLGGTNLFLAGGEAVVTNTAGRVAYHAGGRTTIQGMRLSTSGNTNNVVMVRTNGLTLQNVTLVGASTQFSVSTDIDATNHVRILGSFATAISTNKITNAVGPFTISTFVQ